MRFLLGVAEAGFFPGIILYFTYWFPSHHHARIVSGFLIGLPVAVAVGAPISTALMSAMSTRKFLLRRNIDRVGQAMSPGDKAAVAT